MQRTQPTVKPYFQEDVRFPPKSRDKDMVLIDADDLVAMMLQYELHCVEAHKHIMGLPSANPVSLKVYEDAIEWSKRNRIKIADRQHAIRNLR